MNIYIDIETIPAQNPDVLNSFIAEASVAKSAVRAPSNYKDQAKIDEFISGKHAEIDAGIEEKWRKTSFDGLYGSIACICYAFDDGEVFSVDANTSNGEKMMLEHFYSHLLDKSYVPYNGGMAGMEVTFVGHNVAGFDLPFLKHRSIILGVNPPNVIANAFAAKPWDKCIADTMLMWSSDREKRVSMDKLCKALGIPGKGDFDGSMVASTWPTDPQVVIDYCKADVERTRSMYRRMTFAHVGEAHKTKVAA